MQLSEYKKIISANWKMNGSFTLIDDFKRYFNDKKNNIENDTAVIICPPFPYLDKCYEISKNFSNLYIGAQDCSEKNNSSRTGDISSSILKNIGCDFVIIGHSERRTLFNETEKIISKKILRALEQNLKIIFCIGESHEDKIKFKTFNVLKNQIQNSFNSLCSPENIIIAYEPIWAIGTGDYPSLVEIIEVTEFIQKTLKEESNFKSEQNFKILYGGSVSPLNCKNILSSQNVDGVLVGNSSLKVDDFKKIIKFNDN